MTPPDPPGPEPPGPEPPVEDDTATLVTQVYYYGDYQGHALHLDGILPNDSWRSCMITGGDTYDFENNWDDSVHEYYLTPYFTSVDGYVRVCFCFDTNDSHGFFYWNGSTWVQYGTTAQDLPFDMLTAYFAACCSANNFTHTDILADIGFEKLERLA